MNSSEYLNLNGDLEAIIVFLNTDMVKTKGTHRFYMRFPQNYQFLSHQRALYPGNIVITMPPNGSLKFIINAFVKTKVSEPLNLDILNYVINELEKKIKMLRLKKIAIIIFNDIINVSDSEQRLQKLCSNVDVRIYRV